MQLPKGVTVAEVPMHGGTRSVRLADLARVYFGGNADMARGYRQAAAHVSGPALYAELMGPFYALLSAK